MIWIININIFIKYLSHDYNMEVVKLLNPLANVCEQDTNAG